MSGAAGPGRPAMQRVGAVEVVALADGATDFPADIVATDGPAPAPGATRRCPVNAFLLRTPEGLVLVDTGAGASLGPLTGDLPDALAAAGAAAADIALVLLTHLHPDHVNGLIDGSGAARFPRAVVRVAEAERAYWLDPAEREKASAFARPVFDWAQAALGAYGARVVGFAGDGAVGPRIEAVPAPGHTPGHTAFLLSDGGEALLFAGDLVHFAEIQFAHPDRPNRFDLDAARAAASRRTLLDRAAAHGWTLAGTHLPWPGMGCVEHAGAGLSFRPLLSGADGPCSGRARQRGCPDD